MPISRRFVLAAASVSIAALASPLLAQERDNPEIIGETWPDLQQLIYSGRPVHDGAHFIALAAPYRAHDAAVVPIEIEIIDENPAPVAAVIDAGPSLGRDIHLSTRIRIESYSNVRVVAELDDGALYQVARYVKASGGCAAPALKDADAALAAAGQMRLRVFGDATGRAEAQVMVRHPQYSGFQIDQVTLLPVPAYFVESLEVTQGDDLVFRVEGGISLSEDPSIRFGFTPNGAERFVVRAVDTHGEEFLGSFPVGAQG
jgi:sulfur-oxidizing protein SoxY